VTELNNNKLIDYTKWLFKWLFKWLLIWLIVIIVMISVVYLIFIRNDDFDRSGQLSTLTYGSREIPMFSLECNNLSDLSSDNYISEEERFKFYFMIKKLENEESPHAIYTPAYSNDFIKHDTSEEDVNLKQYFTNVVNNLYVFDKNTNISNVFFDKQLNVNSYKINRKTLEMEHLYGDRYLAEYVCKKISTDEFYNNTKGKLDEIKEELKI